MRRHPVSSRHTLPTLLPLAPLLLVLFGCGGNGGTGPENGNGNGNGEPTPATVVGQAIHSDAGVGSVVVQLRDGPGSDREMTTPNNGEFTFEDVEPGSWQMEFIPPEYFELAGGEAAVRTVQVGEGATVTQNVTLTPVTEPDSPLILATSGLTFSPPNVTVAPGAIVRWENDSDVLHTVTPRDHEEWSEGTLPGNGDTFQAVLNNPGDFDYFCVPHEADGMLGSIRVVVP